MHILICVADSQISTEMESALRRYVAHITVVRGGREALRWLNRNNCDAIILDRGNGIFHGLVILRWIRRRIGNDVPVICAIGGGREDHFQAALEHGADECVFLPAPPQEYVARLLRLVVNVLGRRYRRGPVHIGAYCVDAMAGAVTHRGKAIDLTGKEFALVRLLFGHVGMTLSRALLMRTVWGSVDTKARSLDTHIHRLRRKLGLQGQDGVRLSAVYNGGYRLDQFFVSSNHQD